MTGHQRDPEFVRFARRVGVIAGAAISVILLSRMVLSAATTDVRAMLASESRERIVADSLEAGRRALTDSLFASRTERMATVMELIVLAVAERTDAVQRDEALLRLRRMRRVGP